MHSASFNSYVRHLHAYHVEETNEFILVENSAQLVNPHPLGIHEINDRFIVLKYHNPTAHIGYRLAKVGKEGAICPKLEEWAEVGAGDVISSYMLKQSIMKEYASVYDVTEPVTIQFESLYIPGYNLMHGKKYVQYREMVVSYANLCGRLLTPESINTTQLLHRRRQTEKK